MTRDRLNSGGTQLTPHEIRVALYAGPFVDLLESLNKLDKWRALYGNRSARLRDQELILRIVALYIASNDYARPLKFFLNTFVGNHHQAEGADVKRAAELFEEAVDVLHQGPGQVALRKASRQVNAAQTEAIFVGLMRRLSVGELDPSGVAAAIETLRQDPAFDAATGRATADEEPLTTRLRIATEAFAILP